MMPAYTGTDIEHKPAHLLRNEKLHKKLHIKKYGGWVPTIEQVHAIIDGWVKEYASRPHKGLKGLCPGDVFKAGRGPGVDRADLRHLMMSIEMKNANRNGVSFMGRNYYDEALYGIKDRVTIRYDLADLSSIEIYDVTGARHICTARPREQLHPMARLLGKPEDLAAVKAHIAQKRRLKKQTESVARAFVENSPDLIQIPDLPGAIPAMPRVPEKLPRAEAEHIEAQASRMKVIELKAPDPIFQSAAAKYEYLIELECSGNNGGLTDDQRSFCRQFEGTQEYKILQNRYDFIREISIERNCGTEVSSG
jgi:putative transposase